VGGRYHGPNGGLAATRAVLLGSGRLEIAEGRAPVLTKELRNSRVKADPVTAHGRYGFGTGAMISSGRAP
jgi:hypothetical protein